MNVYIDFVYLYSMSKKQELIESVKDFYIDGVNNQPYPEEYKTHLSKVFEALWEPTLTAVDLGETHATIKYWESKGYLLMPILREVGAWRKFSYVELYWILLLRKVTLMGCSLDIVVPKLINAYEQGFATNKEIYFDEKLGYRDSLEGLSHNLVFNFFGHITAVHMSLIGKYSIHLFNKSYMFSSEHRLGTADAVEAAYKTMFKDSINISLSDVVFMDNQIEGFTRHLMRQNVFSKQEAEILNMLNQKELKELTVILQDGKPVTLELTEKFDITQDDAANRLIQFLNSPYQEIRAVTNGGKTIGFERKTKKKIG